MSNLHLEFNPPESDYQRLIELLDQHGFYGGVIQSHDRKRICDSFREDHFIVLYLDNNPIGFTTWRGELQWAIIDYKWIIPNHRGKGYGRWFSQCIFENFKRNNIIYILAQPASPCGWGMSNSLKFNDFSETDYKFSTSYRYLFLTEDRDNIELSDKGFELLIWSNCDYTKPPKLVYKIDDSMLFNPIITIVDDNAYAELRKDGIKIKRNVCKRFFTDTELQYHGLLYFNKNLSEWEKELGIND